MEFEGYVASHHLRTNECYEATILPLVDRSHGPDPQALGSGGLGGWATRMSTRK